MSNRDIYKDEFGQYHEVEEETEDPTDGFEDDEQDILDEEDDLFDSNDEEEDDYYDEDEEYASGSGNEYDIDDEQVKK